MGTRSEFAGKKKGVVRECGSGLRMQENQTGGSKRLMVFHHDESQLLLFSSSSSSSSSSSTSCCESSIPGGGFVVGGSGGPMFCNTSNQVPCVSDIYDVVGVASASGSATNTATQLLLSNSLNPSNTDSLFSFDSSVGGMAASVNVRVPFTASQLQELERQTMIYKCMVASVPVPNELLLPITKTPSNLPPTQSNIRASMELGVLSSNNSDPEPWRCRRTDGKKWRCSRDVVPDQKYCERHSHKSRPRSRKPVELPAHPINKNDFVTNSLKLASNTINKPYATSHFLNKTMGSSTLSSDQQPRCLEWFMKGETIPSANNSNQEWQQMLQSGLESKTEYSTKGGEYYGEHIFNSNSYFNLGGDSCVVQDQGLHDQYSLFLSPKLVPRQTQTQQTRHFIDAWSIGEGNVSNADGIGNSCFVSCNERLPHSSLTLSMSGGSEIIERNENVLIGTHGITGCSETANVGASRPHWMTHVSGMGSPPGGPLAEALCLGIASSAKSDSNEASPHGCSTSTTTSSSKSSCGDGGRPGTQFY